MKSSARVSKNKVISVAYALRDAKGTLIDEGKAEDPLVYLHGHENLLPAVEKQLEGMPVGGKKSFLVKAADGYGEREPTCPTTSCRRRAWRSSPTSVTARGPS